MQIRHVYRISVMVLLAQCIASCAPPPSINDSREILWQQFAHQPVDNVLMSWGTPAGETHLTDGSRMITYRHSTNYDSGFAMGCEVSFLAQAPSYRIENISMNGSPQECSMLSQGMRGERRINDTPPPPPLYPYPYPYPYRHL